jgi:hypothetical protein
MCRRLTRRQTSWKELLLRVTIVNDPKKMAELSAELQRHKLLSERPTRKIKGLAEEGCRSKLGEIGLR